MGLFAVKKSGAGSLRRRGINATQESYLPLISYNGVWPATTLPVVWITSAL